MSTTKKIWKAGDFFQLAGTRIDMDPEVVVIPNDGVPLDWQFSQSSNLLGRVENIRLENGEILGDIVVWDEKEARALAEFESHGDVRLGGYYTKVIKNDDGTRVLSALLSGVSYVLEARVYGSPGATGNKED